MNYLFAKEPENIPSLKNEIEKPTSSIGKVRGIFKNKIIDPFSNKASNLVEQSQNY